MLVFIQNNGILCSGIFALLGVIITAIVNLIVNRKKERNDTIKELKATIKARDEALATVKEKLRLYEDVAEQEKNIDKSNGAIYYENFPKGGYRSICGYCWEKDHIKIPLIVKLYYDEKLQRNREIGYCESCNATCHGND